MGKGWGLEIERNSAWLVGFGLPGSCRFFRSLRAAIAFAEASTTTSSARRAFLRVIGVAVGGAGDVGVILDAP